MISFLNKPKPYDLHKKQTYTMKTMGLLQLALQLGFFVSYVTCNWAYFIPFNSNRQVARVALDKLHRTPNHIQR